MRRFVALSSTISTCRSRSSRTRASSSLETSGRTRQRGVQKNVVPSPAWLSSQIFPPMRSTSSLQMDSPRPVPVKRRVVEASTCVKGAKIRFWSSSAMPMPVSRTLIRSWTSDPSRDSTDTCTTTSPCSVNLMELPARFMTIWRMRRASPSSRSGTSASTSQASSRPRS